MAGTGSAGGSRIGLGRLAGAVGVPLAAAAAFAGQFLVSMRGRSPYATLAPGIGLYLVAFVLLLLALRARRRSDAAAGGAQRAAGQTAERFLAGRAGWILLGVVLASGLWLRLYRIDIIPWGLNNDEAINAIEANEIAAGKPFATVTRRGLQRETMFHYLAALSFRSPGLGLNVLRAMPAVFGLNPRFIGDPMADLIFPLRAVSIAAGVLTLLAIYLFARNHFPLRVALLAALFLAVSPWHLLYSRVGFRVILAPLFALLTVGLFLRALRTGRMADHLAWGVACGLGFWTYTSFRAIPIALAAFVVLHALARRRRGGAAVPTLPLRPMLSGFAVMMLLFLGLMALSRMTPVEFLARGAYATTPPQTAWGLNLLHAVTLLNYFPGTYAVIQNDAFISDGVAATYGLIGLEPDTLLLAALASLGFVAACFLVLARPGRNDPEDGSRPALALVLLCLVSTWLTVGWLGPSLTRLLPILPWLCLLAALLAVRVWDDVASWKPPFTTWAAALLMAGVAVLATVQGVNNYFWLAGRSDRAMQHFGATQTIMGMFVRAQPPDQDIVLLHTLRVDTLRYLLGGRPRVEMLTDTSKVSLDAVVATQHTITFVVEYARPFAEPLRVLMTRFPQGDMSQVADARFDPDKIIFFTFTLWKDAAGQIMSPPGGSSGPLPPGAPPPF